MEIIKKNEDYLSHTWQKIVDKTKVAAVSYRENIYFLFLASRRHLSTDRDGIATINKETYIRRSIYIYILLTFKIYIYIFTPIFPTHTHIAYFSCRVYRDGNSSQFDREKNKTLLFNNKRSSPSSLSRFFFFLTTFSLFFLFYFLWLSPFSFQEKVHAWWIISSFFRQNGFLVSFFDGCRFFAPIIKDEFQNWWIWII